MTLDVLLTNMGTVLTSIFTWCTSGIDFIVQHPIVYVPMLISIVSAVTLGIVSRLIRG